MQAILREGKLHWINGAEKGYKSARPTDEVIPIPDQDVGGLFQWIEVENDDAMSHWKLVGTLADLILKFPIEALPASEHIGKLISVNPSQAKPATVRRRFMGENYDVSCLVTQNIVNMWLSNPKQLDIGDYVLVSFIEEIPDTEERQIAIVTDKAYKSW